MKNLQAIFFFSTISLFSFKTVVYCQIPEAFVKADSLIENFMEEGHIPGLFVAVVRGDSILFKNSKGMAIPEKNIPITEFTCMELGSISKIFTAEIVISLHNEGKLSVHDPVTKYLSNAPSSWENITIHNLLNHSSGIMNYLLDHRFMAFEYFTNKNDVQSEKFFSSITSNSMVDMFYGLPLEFSPGFTWSYSNTGYYLLGKISEIATGKTFKDLVNERFLHPLEMDDTRFNEEAEAQHCLARGYFLSEPGMKESRVLSSSYAFSAGAWATTGSDMVKFLKAVHNDKLPSQKTHYTWLSDTGMYNLPFDYNGGRFFSRFHGLDIISHAGGTPGFSSSWIHVEEKNISIIVLINRQDYAPVDLLAWDVLSCFEPLLKYPGVAMEGAYAAIVEQEVMSFVRSVQNDSLISAPFTDQLKVFINSENGRGLWKWYFDRGFPNSAICVDKEMDGDKVIFRFLLPFTDKTAYRLTVIKNKSGKITQLRWW